MNTLELHKLSAVALHNEFIAGTYSAEQIVIYFLDRIEKLDTEIKSFLVIFKEEALATAKELDRKKAANLPLGSLAAVPISIKDLIHIKGKKTTCGSRLLENYVAPFNATVIEHLKKEDAIFLGKVNLDEFGMGTLGEHSAFVQTVNPWDKQRFPGGSSSGSAASVAAKLCPISLGSDTGGSIRLPASFCGIFGFKPSYGAISRYGLAAFASSLDQIGLCTHSAEDLDYIFSVVSRECALDANWHSVKTYTNPPSLDKITVGVLGNNLQNPKEVQECLDCALEKFSSSSCKIINIDMPLSVYEDALRTYYVLCTAQASSNLARYDGIRFGKQEKDPSSFINTVKKTRSTLLGAEVKRRILLGNYFLSSLQTKNYYQLALKNVRYLKQFFKNVFKQCDYVLLPVSSCTSIPLGCEMDPLERQLLDQYTVPISLAGLPSLCFPVRICDDGLPMGCQLAGPHGSDRYLTKLAPQIGAMFSVSLPW